MRLLYFSAYISVIIGIFSSCTNQKAESSLLTNKTSCSLKDCPEPQKKIDGSLSIEADAGVYQLNVDKSDVLEIAGKCADLGVRDNRILVEMYQGEDVSLPDALFFENSSSVNCVNSKTPSLNGKRCFWVTQGRSVIDFGAEYPQCFNGRFSFSVKVGRILRTTESGAGAVTDEAVNPRRKYFVRFKLRANDGAISESGWASTLIDRGVTKPTFSQDSLPFNEFKCDIKINAFRNLESLLDISYDIRYTPEYINTVLGTEVAATPFPITFTEPIPATPLAHVTNYRIPNIIPGVKYKVKVKAYDKKYSYALQPSPGTTPEESLFSEELQCGYTTIPLNYSCLLDGSLGAPPTSPTNTCGVYTAGTPYSSTCVGSLKTCNLQITDFPSLPGGYPGIMQFMVVKGKTSWDPNYEPPAALGNCTGPVGGAPEGCIQNVPLGTTDWAFRPELYPKNTCTSPSVNTLNGKYAIAARYWRSATEKGAWSNMVTCEFKN